MGTQFYCARCHEPVRIAPDGTHHEGHVIAARDQSCGLWGFETRHDPDSNEDWTGYNEPPEEKR